MDTRCIREIIIGGLGRGVIVLDGKDGIFRTITALSLIHTASQNGPGCRAEDTPSTNRYMLEIQLVRHHYHHHHLRHFRRCLRHGF